MTEIYVSTDIEADGPIPGPNSMLAFGACAVRADGETCGEFQRNLEPLPGAVQDHATALFWANHFKAFEATRQDTVDPQQAMLDFAAWLDSLSKQGKLVFIGFPAAYDFMWIQWYLHRFVGRNPFGHAALDIKTLAMIFFDCEFSAATLSRMPSEWFTPSTLRPHTAIDDAREQARLFVHILKALRETSRSEFFGNDRPLWL